MSKAKRDKDEPALLFTECEKKSDNVLFLNEGNLTPNANVQSNLWYLDNGASNHMTGRLTYLKIWMKV